MRLRCTFRGGTPLLMGRPAKNPSHPLTRLRAQLSTPNHQITRQNLAKRTGIPVDTIKDIETGRFALSGENAFKIALATGVDGESLLKGDEPLLDLLGEQVSNKSHRLVDHLLWSEAEADSVVGLFSVVLHAAQEKGRAMHFYFLFRQWLPKTAELLGVLPEVRERLEPILGSLYPGLSLPESFYPENRKDRLKWEMVLQYRADKFKTEMLKHMEILRGAASRAELVKYKNKIEKIILENLNSQ
jgi:transcriptional regulator with XRE-family HTH domain